MTPNGLRPSLASKEGIVANIIGAPQKYNEGTDEQTEDYWRWDRSRDEWSNDMSEFAFVLERPAWSKTVDFYTGGLYRFYLTLSQHIKGKTSYAKGDIAATTKLIEIRLPHDPDAIKKAVVETDDKVKERGRRLDVTATTLIMMCPFFVF